MVSCSLSIRRSILPRPKVCKTRRNHVEEDEEPPPPPPPPEDPCLANPLYQEIDDPWADIPFEVKSNHPEYPPEAWVTAAIIAPEQYVTDWPFRNDNEWDHQNIEGPHDEGLWTIEIVFTYEPGVTCSAQIQVNVPEE